MRQKLSINAAHHYVIPRFRGEQPAETSTILQAATKVRGACGAEKDYSSVQ